jgi:hypothetical protein
MQHPEFHSIPMLHPAPTSLVIAVRVYPEPKVSEKDFDRPERKWRLPQAMFVFDTETSTDHTQRLKFGSFRFVLGGRCLKEALFYADDLSTRERRVLAQYVVDEDLSQLLLLKRADLLKELYRDAYKGRCLLIGFNLPFDLSRLACDSGYAKKRFAGGFSLGLWSYTDKNGTQRLDPNRPAIAIKHIDSKRALKGFTDRKDQDEEDRIPEGSITGRPEDDYIFRGHLLDLRTLAFSLTDRGHSLETACEAFDVEHGKEAAPNHGTVTPEYIEYNRSDVLATSELAIKLLEEYGKHPINLQPTKAYSPASIGKAYLRAMRIVPILERQPGFPKHYLGHSQSAFYGGRTSAHIRKVPVPVVYTDFLSMYPTVNSLMELWKLVTAKKIQVVEHCQSDVQTILGDLKENPDVLFDRDTWKFLTAFVKIRPDGDVLPSRGRYSATSNDYQVAVNYLYSDCDDPKQTLWFALPDVMASVVLNGKIPEIVDAFRIEPSGKLDRMKSTKLRGAIEIDPAQEDFFKVVIEQRKGLPSRTDLSESEKDRLDKALKVLANATSYGIYAEMHRLESDRKVKVTCYGIDAEPFKPWVTHPDEPGAYCFPPLASLITGAARLMLALLEYKVEKLGGTYAMEDTDSMAIVATEDGGMIACPGGPYRTSDGGEAIKALTWKQVEQIVQQFANLNPYERDAIPGSILKIEDDNFDPITANQRQLYCLAISAKRYALFIVDHDGKPALLRASCPHCGRKNKPTHSSCAKCEKSIQINNKDDRWSEHGLGHLLNPADPENEDREWIAEVWLSMIKRSLGTPAQPVHFQNLPAAGRITVSSPALMRPLENLNAGKQYCDRVKPFNFLLSCHVKQFGHPIGSDPTRFHLIGPYNSDSRKWLNIEWIDQYSGKPYRITTAGYHGNRQTARVKTYGEVLREYEYHPESKCADKDGNRCNKQTTGLLQRRHIKIDLIKYIGKESNSLEDVDSGLIHSADNVYTEYIDLKRDEWSTKIVPVLQRTALSKLIKLTGKSRRMLIDARTGKRRPHPKSQELIVSALKEAGLISSLISI